MLNLQVNDGESEQIFCALQKKEITSNDYNTKYNIVDANPYNGCNSIQNSTFNNKAVFLLLDSPSCSLQVIMQNLEENKVAVAIFGLNGTIVRN